MASMSRPEPSGTATMILCPDLVPMGTDTASSPWSCAVSRLTACRALPPVLTKNMSLLLFAEAAPGEGCEERRPGNELQPERCEDDDAEGAAVAVCRFSGMGRTWWAAIKGRCIDDDDSGSGDCHCIAFDQEIGLNKVLWREDGIASKVLLW
jgi:hypothetical protein